MRERLRGMQFTRDFCRELSLGAGEEMFGTASRVDLWLLIESPGSWVKDALDQSPVPKNVKNRLSVLQGSIPNTRVQLIKHGEESTDKLRFFVAGSRELSPIVFEFKLNTYGDILDIDVPGILSSPVDYAEFRREGPLYLVCTHGRYDSCCAGWGTTVFREMSAIAGDCVWQSTHVGGHRFAANVVCLPHGIYYGRISQSDAGRVVDAYASGEIVLDKLRGRACYPKEAQAAEYFLRSNTGVTAVEEFRLEGVDALSESRLRAVFASRSGGHRYLVVVDKDTSTVETITSCGDPEPSQPPQYRLVECKRSD